ncbi:hypothetical protein M2232_009199 [Bradyrhizobium japonicum]|uniref:hypothetical protein n=1 Tax=Bradyrhizobium japonicum TaxID=375 RepID=UPI0022266951|nr:hypothetical protein [Bradyrhizobium japonicum]MCW2225667.1 hypothetical protein [Bradyrhizobium japonicum]MCW2340879.1 hypothetical protein [Bradyrhizobium japonicum]
MSNQPPTNQSEHLVDQSNIAVPTQNARPNLTGASYAIGEVWDDECMGRNEFPVASAMCFQALYDRESAMSLADILTATKLKVREANRAIERLASAGLVRMIRPSMQELESGPLSIRYELWSAAHLVQAEP